MKLLIIHSNKKSPWITTDKSILMGSYDVQDLLISDVSSKEELFNAVKDSDIIIFWFASFQFYPAWLMAKFLRKKTVIIAGGYDVSRLPSINYGAFNANFFLRFFRQVLFYFSDSIIGVSKSNLKEIKDNVLSSKKLAFAYLGFDTSHLPDLKQSLERLPQVVMIANLPDEQTYLLKGMDIFLESARRMPTVKFVHIGKLDYILKDIPANIELLGEIKHGSQEFYEVLNSSKIIFQHSMIESFCASVVDGALMGCLPLVSDRFSLPEVVGKDGIVVNYGDLSALQKAIEKNINSFDSPGLLREKYALKYSLENRKTKLLQILQGL